MRHSFKSMLKLIHVLADLEEFFQVGPQQLHDHRVELGAARAAGPDLVHLRDPGLRGRMAVYAKFLKNLKGLREVLCLSEKAASLSRIFRWKILNTGLGHYQYTPNPCDFSIIWLNLVDIPYSLCSYSNNEYLFRKRKYSNIEFHSYSLRTIHMEH